MFLFLLISGAFDVDFSTQQNISNLSRNLFKAKEFNYLNMNQSTPVPGTSQLETDLSTKMTLLDDSDQFLLDDSQHDTTLNKMLVLKISQILGKDLATAINSSLESDTTNSSEPEAILSPKMEEELVKLNKRFLNTPSIALKYLKNQDNLKKAKDHYKINDKIYRIISACKSRKRKKDLFTYFIIDTTLFHYCIKTLPEDENKLFKLFAVWALSVFYVGKGAPKERKKSKKENKRLFEHLGNGVYQLQVSVYSKKNYQG